MAEKFYEYRHIILEVLTRADCLHDQIPTVRVCVCVYMCVPYIHATCAVKPISIFTQDISRIPNSAVKNEIIPRAQYCRIIPPPSYHGAGLITRQYPDKSFYAHTHDISTMLFFRLDVIYLFLFLSLAAASINSCNVILYTRVKKYPSTPLRARGEKKRAKKKTIKP